MAERRSHSADEKRMVDRDDSISSQDEINQNARHMTSVARRHIAKQPSLRQIPQSAGRRGSRRSSFAAAAALASTPPTESVQGSFVSNSSAAEV